MTSVVWNDGYFYIAEGAYPGSIIRMDMNGNKRTLVEGLKSGADHFTTSITVGLDGKMYFGVGTVTNSAVVGLDNFLFGWLPDHPKLHDTPSRDVVLAGENFESPDPLKLVNGKVVMKSTGAFKPFGTPSKPRELVKGSFLSNAVIYRCNPDGSDLEIYADGIRNPFGLEFSPEGLLYAIDQGYDNRGSRSIAEAPDPMWRIVKGGWYGWPDYVAGEPVTDPKFKPPGKSQPPFVLADHPMIAGRPIVKLPVHSASMKFDFSKNQRFGYIGEAFVAQLGTGAPVTGLPLGFPGFKVVRVNLQNKTINDFLVIKKPLIDGTGPARPVQAKFDLSGENLYVVDFGILQANASGIIPWAASGALWKISRK